MYEDIVRVVRLGRAIRVVGDTSCGRHFGTRCVRIIVQCGGLTGVLRE